MKLYRMMYHLNAPCSYEHSRHVMVVAKNVTDATKIGLEYLKEIGVTSCSIAEVHECESAVVTRGLVNGLKAKS